MRGWDESLANRRRSDWLDEVVATMSVAVSAWFGDV